MSKDSEHEKGLLNRLGKIRDNLKKKEKKYTEYKYERIQAITEIGLKLRNDADEWAIFCKDHFWRKNNLKNPPKVDNPKTALQHSFIYAYSKLSAGRDMPSLHYRAVEAILVDSVPCEKIAEELNKRGGITGTVQKSKYNNGKVGNRSNDGSANKDRQKARFTSLKRMPIDLDKQLVVDLPHTDIKKACNLKEGDNFWVLCEHKGSNDQGVLIFEGIEFGEL